MKTNTLIFSLAIFAVSVLSSCRKDYDCKATAPNGTETHYSCTCTTKEVSTYKDEIKSKGYTSADCSKK
jgi:hypothetical protein